MNALAEKRRQEQGARLKSARQDAGFKSAAAAASRFKWHEHNYRDHEAGRRGMSVEIATTYAKALGSNAWWILTGKSDHEVTVDAAPLNEALLLACIEDFLSRSENPRVAEWAAQRILQLYKIALHTDADPLQSREIRILSDALTAQPLQAANNP